MAKEISASLNVTINDAGNAVQGASSFQVDFSGSLISTEILVPTSSTLLSLAPVTTPKVLFIKNMDATNFIDIDHVTGFTSWKQRLQPGQGILLLPLDGTIYGKADTASVKIFVVAG